MRPVRLTLTLVLFLTGCGGPSMPSPQLGATASSSGDPANDASQRLVALVVTAPATLVRGTWAPITATGIDANGRRSNVTRTVTWSSTDFLAAAATDGNLYAVGVGSATIGATLGELHATADVEVLAVTLDALTLTGDTETMPAGAASAWHATARYNDGSSVDVTASATWTTSDETVAAVDGPGRVRAVGAGMTMVSASIAGQQASAPLLVAAATLTNLHIEGSGATMPATGSQQLAAVGTYSDGSTADLTTTVDWYSSDDLIATVRQGCVQAVSAGAVRISASSGTLFGAIDLTLSER